MTLRNARPEKTTTVPGVSAAIEVAEESKIRLPSGAVPLYAPLTVAASMTFVSGFHCTSNVCCDGTNPVANTGFAPFGDSETAGAPLEAAAGAPLETAAGAALATAAPPLKSVAVALPPEIGAALEAPAAALASLEATGMADPGLAAGSTLASVAAVAFVPDAEVEA